MIGEKYRKMEYTMKKVLFIASTGGHLNELMQLKPKKNIKIEFLTYIMEQGLI